MATTQINAVIPKDLKKQLDHFCIENDAKQKDVVLEALKQFLGSKKKQN